VIQIIAILGAIIAVDAFLIEKVIIVEELRLSVDVVQHKVCVEGQLTVDTVQVHDLGQVSCLVV
jgi:hypothetical protein